ncbi:hypothetical protein MATL_G00214100 [Megalops atlanticus]|uniref:Uncharacterized protein n=1 Tax=Megalops atlanticus TaxID=7932 RepID=A0A9D3PGB5_MEGAT|nr:hypothetical protein MATL_G00214100 [Megalops atlanticus]
MSRADTSLRLKSGAYLPLTHGCQTVELVVVGWGGGGGGNFGGPCIQETERDSAPLVLLGVSLSVCARLPSSQITLSPGVCPHARCSIRLVWTPFSQVM